jgi:hypothetical protein
MAPGGGPLQQRAVAPGARSRTIGAHAAWGEEVGMSMRTREFVERINAIKASLKHGEAPSLAEPLQRLQQRVRDTWNPDELKALLQQDAEVPTGLEEEMTTLTMEWMRQRGSSG